MRATPGLTSPRIALNTPVLLPAPMPTAPRGAKIRGAPVLSFENYTLDSGDRVHIAVFGQDNLSGVYGVDASGYVAMPLVGAVRARGLNTFQLASAAASTLGAKYIKDPKVTAEVETTARSMCWAK